MLSSMERATRKYSLDDFDSWCARNLLIVNKKAQLINLNLRSIQKKYLDIKRKVIKEGKPKRFILLKYRQGGFTTIEQALSYHMSTQCENVSVMTLADTHRKTSDIFEIVQRYYNNHAEAPKRKGVGNSYRMDFPSLNSRFICGTAAASSEARGGTYQRIHGSEVAFWCQGGNQKDKQREVMAGLEEAAAEGEIVLESTPNGMDLFHDIYNAAKRGENDYTPIFLPWYMDESNRVDVELDEAEHIMLNLSDREEELIRLHQLDVNQIKWRRRTEKRLGPLFRQEHPEDDVSCFLTGGTCRFDTKICVDLLEGIPDYINERVSGIEKRMLNSHTYEVRWAKPVPGVEYVVGCDTSEGLPGGDRCGLGIMRRDTAEQVAAIHGLLTPKELAKHAVRICKEYNNALLGIERENHGHAVLSQVWDYGYRKNLFHHRPGKPGWSTNAVTKPQMLDEIADLLSDPDLAETWVRDREFLQECLTYVKRGNSWGSSSGAHDDCVMKWAVASMMRKQKRIKPGIVVLRPRDGRSRQSRPGPTL